MCHFNNIRKIFFWIYFFSEYDAIFNIGFIISVGESIDRQRMGNFLKQIEFVKGLSKTFNVAWNDTNVGIITYSNDSAVRYRFGDISDQTELEEALDNITRRGDGRNIGKALDLARTDLFNISNTGRNVTARNILIVVTDGGSDDDILVPTIGLKNVNVTIFGIGIDQYVLPELNDMASDPNAEHVFTIDFYDDLGPTMGPLKDAIIKGMEVRIVCQTKRCK